MKKKIKKNNFADSSLYYIFISFVLFLSLVLYIAVSPNIKFIKVFSVNSGSMEPSIRNGSLIITMQKPLYKVDDVITYYNEAGLPGQLAGTVTHRIRNIKNRGNMVFYTTKGDANDVPDKKWIPDDLVIGKVVLEYPNLGGYYNYAKSAQGAILLIIIPSVFIVYTEALKIRRELV